MAAVINVELGSVGTFECFSKVSGSTHPEAGSKAIKYTTYCSPQFNGGGGGVRAVSLRVLKATNYCCYVGAAPSYFDQSKGLNRGLGFAIDGTVRFQKAKIQSGSSERKYKVGEELCLTYEPANQTVTLWRYSDPSWTELSSFQGVPDDWRFACGVDCCSGSFELLPTRVPQALYAAGATAPSATAPPDVSDPAEPPDATPAAPPKAAPARVASSGNFADAQKLAAATTIQGVYNNRRGNSMSGAGAAATTFEFNGADKKRTQVDGSTCKNHWPGSPVTVFCSPPLSSLACGQPSVRLVLKKASNSNTYVGAAPADCNPDRGLNKTGVGFAMDGTLRFQKTKIKPSGSGRAFAVDDELTLTYEVASQTLGLWHEGVQIQDFQGVPTDWRLAIGADCCNCEYELLPPLTKAAVVPTLDGEQWTKAAVFETEATESVHISDFGRTLRADKERYPRLYHPMVAYMSPSFEQCTEDTVRLPLKWLSAEDTNWIYLGAYPPDNNTKTKIEYAGLAFAADGTLRFRGNKKESGKCFLHLSSVHEENELRYDKTTQTVSLWRLKPEDGSTNDTPLQSFDGIPPHWRFAIGLESCYVEIQLMELQAATPQAATPQAPAPAIMKPAPTPTPPAPPPAPPTSFAAAQQNAAATQVQAIYRRNQGKKDAHEMRVQRRFINKRKSSMAARSQVDASSEEYAEVTGFFLEKLAPSERVRCRIATVERLHVPDILDQYELIVKQMTRREQKRRDAEKEAIAEGLIELAWVFHACAAEAVDSIICGGFNRSYAGKNATFYGPGCYFARDTSYSARDTYSPPDPQTGMKRIFMCRIALGANCPVKYGYSEREPPVRDAERLLGVGELRYDTTADQSKIIDGIPGIMVAFKDNQAYAEYLVTFKLVAE